MILTRSTGNEVICRTGLLLEMKNYEDIILWTVHSSCKKLFGWHNLKVRLAGVRYQ